MQGSPPEPDQSPSLEGRDAAKKALKAFLRQQSPGFEPLVASLSGESDRGTIILMATILEDTLAQRIAFRMRPLNSDMRQALFGPEGSLGSFSAKIRTAYALKIFENKCSTALRSYVKCGIHARILGHHCHFLRQNSLKRAMFSLLQPAGIGSMLLIPFC